MSEDLKRQKRFPIGVAVVFLLAGAVFLMAHQVVGVAVVGLGVIFLAVAARSKLKS
jgi:hypothetical protein